MNPLQLAAAALVLLLCAPALANHVSVTYTSDADFALGTASGVNYTATPNQLQLDTVGTTFPVLWVANAGEDTVSKFDTTNNREIARYRTWFGPSGQPGYYNHVGNAYAGAAPSRTAVDLDGNAYVLNRHFDGRPARLFKILSEGGIDRNGNGVIDTSFDANNDGLIQAAEMKPMADANANGRVDDAEIQDERIAWSVTIGGNDGLGRAMCIGTDGHLWVGLYNHRQYYKVSAADGSIIAGPVSVNWTPYGCAIDASGVLWSASLGPLLGKIGNTGSNTGPYPVTSYNGGRSNYGIALGNGKVYLGMANQQFNPATNTFSIIPNLLSTAGIVVDGAGNIIGGQGTIRKVSPTGALLWSAPLQSGASTSIGIQVDSNNDVWQIGYNSNRVHKHSGATGAAMGTFAIGNRPYTYSDATGLSARTVTTNSGTWTVVRDSGRSATPWLRVDWHETLPAGSSVIVRLRAADTQAGLAFAAWTQAGNGAPIAGIAGRFVQVEARLNANLADDSPILQDLTVLQGHTNEPPVALNDAYATPEDTALAVAAPGVLGNDTDADAGDTKTAVLVAGPANGTLVLDANGSFSYTPAANFNGGDSFSYRAVDAAGESSGIASVSIAVSPVNDPPSAAAAAPRPIDEDTSVVITVTGSDIDSGALQVGAGGAANGTVTVGPVSCKAMGGGSTCTADVTYTPAPNFHGTDAFTFSVGDGSASSGGSVSITVLPVNDAPSGVVLGLTPSVDENGVATLSGSFADPDAADGHAVTIAWGDGTSSTLQLAPGVLQFTASHQYLDDPASGADVFAVGVTVADGAGASAGAAASVAVANVAPVLATLTGPASPVAAGTPIEISASFGDVGTLDTHTCTFSWNDGTADTVVAASAGTCTASHAYTDSNVYAVNVTVSDDDGGSASASYQYAVVYDPSAGFVTGGGWILSPAGAYARDPALAGKATFGFVSKYLRGATVPSGNTEFQFHAARFSFKSTSYEWLVVSGQKARYRGEGMVNGVAGYGFELTAWDDGGNDRIRVKIWDRNQGNGVVYDNEMGTPDGADPTTALGGGNIMIHR